jgi:hypothetical protein
MFMPAEPGSKRYFIIHEALRKGACTDALYSRMHVKPWFIERMRELVELEEQVPAPRAAGGADQRTGLRRMSKHRRGRAGEGDMITQIKAQELDPWLS